MTELVAAVLMLTNDLVRLNNSGDGIQVDGILVEGNDRMADRVVEHMTDWALRTSFLGRTLTRNYTPGCPHLTWSCWKGSEE